LGLLLLLVFIFYQQIFGFLDESSILLSPAALKVKYILLLGCIAWLLIEVIKLLKNRLLKRFDISSEDNLKSRKYHTQINLLEKVINIVIVVGAVGLMMLSIERIREIGIGILASAGVVGLIVGLSAQKIIGAILAGIQIAVAQPFRIDDAVVVENEWGWIEEIN